LARGGRVVARRPASILHQPQGSSRSTAKSLGNGRSGHETAVVGSIIFVISVTLVAGKLLLRACSPPDSWPRPRLGCPRTGALCRRDPTDTPAAAGPPNAGAARP